MLEIDPEKAVRMEKAGFGEVEHVAIFDEAQRSWTHKRLADYLKRGGTYGNKLKVPNFPMSEASLPFENKTGSSGPFRSGRAVVSACVRAPVR